MEERIVYIRRIEGTDKTRLPKDLLAEAKRDIGPAFNEFGQILKGVTGAEEQAIMPAIVGVSINDNTFQEKVERFWLNLSIKTKSGIGVKLNIGIGPDGTPLAPLDYVKYKYCLKYKWCAGSEAEILDKPYALYYIDDPITATAKQVKELGARNEAKLKYLELIQDDDRMNAVLSVLTEYKNPAVLSKEDKTLILEDRSNRTPKEFVAVTKDDKLLLKSFVYRCISAGVFKQSGSRIIYDDEVLGEDLDSTVAFLKSKEGSKYYVTAEGKLKQWALNK